VRTARKQFVMWGTVQYNQAANKEDTFHFPCNICFHFILFL
jgi:hypothetical protein